MISYKWITPVFFFLAPNYVGAQKLKQIRAPKKTSIKVDNDISENHPPINSPIANELKKIDFAEITDDYILIPNSATELDEDGTIPTIEAAYSYVINVIDKDVIGARFLGEELNSPLKKKHYLESDEYKTDFEDIKEEREIILKHDYFIESDFDSQFNLDTQNFSFELYNPNDYHIMINSTDSHFDNRNNVFNSPAISEDLAYQIETNKVKKFLIVCIAEKVNREYSERIVIIPKKLYLAKTKDGKILYEYEFKETEQIEKPKKETNKVYDMVEEMPKYPGGEAALFRDLSDNLVYPQTEIEGKVIIKATIEKDGSIGETTVSRSVDPSLDKAAIDAIKKLKRFTAGKQNGENVRTWITIPVTFRIQ